MTDEHVQAGLRGRLVLPVARAAAAGQRRPVRRAPGRRVERERLRRVFAQGLDAVVGYALPLAAATDGARWRTGPWFLRDERLYLMPGDSPMGYRLPLDSLPWVGRRRLSRTLRERDPFAPRPPLPPRRDCDRPRPRRRSRIDVAGAAPATPAPAIAPGAVRVGAPGRAHRAVRRAARRRALRLHAAGRDARGLPRARRRGRSDGARRSACRVLLEGYPPPHDPRLQHVSRHARPRRDRGQHPAGAELGRARRADDDALRGGAPVAA